MRNDHEHISDNNFTGPFRDTNGKRYWKSHCRVCSVRIKRDDDPNNRPRNGAEFSPEKPKAMAAVAK